MDPINNNQFEIIPNTKSKRKITTPCPNVYLNPALDLLANDDPICNTKMEIVPVKKRKRTRSCEIAAFENTALDLGISKVAVNEFLIRELENVKKNIRAFASEGNITGNKIFLNETTRNTLDLGITLNGNSNHGTESVNAHLTDAIDITLNDLVAQPINAHLTDLYDSVTVPFEELGVSIDNTKDISMVECVNEVEAPSNVDLTNADSCMEISKIDEYTDLGYSDYEHKPLQAGSSLQNNDLSAITNTTNIQTSVTNQVFVNNTSNLSLSFIDRLALDSPSTSNQSLYFDDDLNESNIMEIKTITIITKKKRIVTEKKNTNPFLDPNLDLNVEPIGRNPFLDNELSKPELEYTDEAINRPVNANKQVVTKNLMPRVLFSGDTNSTISTVNDSTIEMHEYENVDSYRSESPIYENIGEDFNEVKINKQSKILGHDVSQFSAVDIINLNKNSRANSSNDSNDSKKDFKHHLLKASNKLSKKVLKTFKKTFKHDKVDQNLTLNPYEVPRKVPKQKTVPKESGIENPALALNNSDEIEIEELEDEHQYETIKTLRNTRLNMNVTPLKERNDDNTDVSHNKTYTPGKKVRFDATLNQEKVITGNSFDLGIQSPGFDAKIDKYHDELENCINERKFLQQNM